MRGGGEQNVDGSGRGPEKVQALKDNSNHFRAALLRMGCTVLGDWDSPVMVQALSRIYGGWIWGAGCMHLDV